MTTVKPPPPPALDRFGLKSPKGSLPHPAEHAWVPIRDLHARHRRRILDHLLQLDERDRYLRFGSQVSHEQMAKYVASIDFKRDEVFGVFNRKLHLVAMAHLAAMPGHLGERAGGTPFRHLAL